MLEQILQEQFRSPGSPRGVIFTCTRQSTHSLLLWLQQQPGLQTVDIRAQLLIGAGNSSRTIHMTQVWALGKGAEAGGIPQGRRGEDLQHIEMGGLVIPRQRAESWGREVNTEIHFRAECSI